MNIHVLFKVDVFQDPEPVVVAENLSIGEYQKRVGMILDVLVSTLHRPVNVSYSSDNLTCIIELTESISFNKYKVLKYYLKHIDVLNGIKLAFNATRAFSFGNKGFIYVAQDDNEYVAVILQGYQLRNVIKALTYTNSNGTVCIPIGELKAVWPKVNELLEVYYNLCKDLKD